VLPSKKVKNILVNVFDHGINERAIMNTKRMFAYAETEHRFLDSGGFQLHEAEKESKPMIFDWRLPIMNSNNRINISPAHVVETACRLEPHTMTSLDFPVLKMKDQTCREQEFLRKLGFNVKWAMATASLRERRCPKVKLLIPVQAYDLSQFNFFYTLIQHVSFDGLSMPLRNLNPPEVALFLLRFYQLGIQRVHLLGSSSFFNLAVAAFFARHFFQWVGTDSTTWRVAAEHNGYLNPNDLSVRGIGSDVLIDQSLPIICRCPFCENMTFTSIKNLPYSDKVALLRSHNFWVIEPVAQDLYKNATDLLSFEKFLRKRSPRTKDIEDLIRCLSLIDLFKKEDINVLKPFFQKAI
jgi:hypothetical protein